MPYYKPLKKMSSQDRIRTVDGINRLREQFAAMNFPQKNSHSTLILGTWNIRNFDDDRFNYGPRTKEALYYIAEIISRFDIIAVQEICVNLRPLKQLLYILGDNYDFIVSDETHSSLGGNQERLGFIYDKNKVDFKSVVGEIVLPPKMELSKVYKEKRQFARTPYGAEFQSEWFKFYFSTVHIYFGSNSPNSDKYKRRVKEIQAVAKYLADQSEKSNSNQILVGDFNIKKVGSPGFNALQEEGFEMVRNKRGSNKDETKFYDQISFLPRENVLELMEPDRDDHSFQFFDSVYRTEDFNVYKPIMLERIKDKLSKAKKALAVATRKKDKESLQNEIDNLTEAKKNNTNLKKYYDKWRTFQISDHIPLWVEIKIDFSSQYLEYLRGYGEE